VRPPAVLYTDTLDELLELFMPAARGLLDAADAAGVTPVPPGWITEQMAVRSGFAAGSEEASNLERIVRLAELLTRELVRAQTEARS
jgi:hypothetical protein